MSENAPQYLHKKKSFISWNWWGENPVEIILVVFIIAFFFALPRAGCGITERVDADGSISTITLP